MRRPENHVVKESQCNGVKPQPRTGDSRGQVQPVPAKTSKQLKLERLIAHPSHRTKSSGDRVSRTDGQNNQPSISRRTQPARVDSANANRDSHLRSPQAIATTAVNTPEPRTNALRGSEVTLSISDCVAWVIFLIAGRLAKMPFRASPATPNRSQFERVRVCLANSIRSRPATVAPVPPVY